MRKILNELHIWNNYYYINIYMNLSIYNNYTECNGKTSTESCKRVVLKIIIVYIIYYAYMLIY